MSNEPIKKKLFRNNDGEIIYPESSMDQILDPDLGNLKTYLLNNVEGGGDKSRELLSDQLISTVKTWSSSKIWEMLTEQEIRLLKKLPSVTTIDGNTITSTNSLVKVVSEIDNDAGTILESTYDATTNELLERRLTTINGNSITEEVLVENEYARVKAIPPDMSVDTNNDGKVD